jgi:cephalosporin-C deacetylase-like acetyl esterase
VDLLRTSVIRCGTAILFMLTTISAIPGQQPPEPKPGDRMIEAYLANLTDRLSQRVFDGAKTRQEWDSCRQRLRQEYLDMLGLWPLPEKTPLHATVTGTLEREGVVIEKVHFQSRPGLYVTGNLYRPAKSSGRLPTVLYVCGHSAHGRDGNKASFQDHGMWFGSNGYVCLIIDTLQLGEVPGIHHGTYREGRWWWQAAGYTPAGVECWNGVRAIDYLVSRPEVDAEKIGVTGISGGGAATFWIAAADERVKCAVPVSGMSDLESYVKNKVINGHCDCMFLINTYGWEWTTIAALIAPRPLLFCNSDMDPIFPMDGNRRIITRLRQLYQMYDKPDLVDDHVSKGGHDYRPDLRVAVFKWINKHLKNDTGDVKDADFKPLKGPELRAFPEDKDVPADALNGKIDETFVPRAQVKLPAEGKFDEWKKGLMKELRERSFRTFPDRVPKPNVKGGDVSGQGALMLLETEPEIGKIELSIELNKGDEGLRTLIVLNSDEDAAKATQGWAKDFLNKGFRYYLAPRGMAQTAWTVKSPPNYVERAHALLGRTVDDGRVWDILAALRAVDEKREAKWRVAGRGRAGALAAYAALFEPSIKEVVIVDPPASHRAGPIFLNVLRALDIPDALGMLAPTPLTLINANDKAFDRTEQIYKAAGAADKLQRKRSP